MRLTTEESDESLCTFESSRDSSNNLVSSEAIYEADTTTKPINSGYANGYSRTVTNGNGITASDITSPRKVKPSHRTDELDSSKSPVHRLDLLGTRLYDDSYIDREEFIRLIIQSLRDVGYS